jgi:hypothetical protein
MFCRCNRPFVWNGGWQHSVSRVLSSCRDWAPNSSCIHRLIGWLIDWLIDYDGVRICLRTADTNGPIFHPPGDMWAWRAMVMIIPAGDNFWLVRQSSLTVLPVETSGASRRNGRRSENFAYQYLKYLKGSLTYRKILQDGTSGFTSHPMEGVLRIIIALKNASPRPGLNPRPLGPVASTNRYTTEASCVHRPGNDRKLILLLTLAHMWAVVGSLLPWQTLRRCITGSGIAPRGALRMSRECIEL